MASSWVLSGSRAQSARVVASAHCQIRLVERVQQRGGVESMQSMAGGWEALHELLSLRTGAGEESRSHQSPRSQHRTG